MFAGHYDETEQWSWFLGTQCLGTSPVRCHWIYAQPYVPQNQLFVCNKCGEVWARIFRPSADSWHIESRHCPRCGPGFLLPFDEQWIATAPPSILRREVLLIAELPDPDRYEILLIFRNTL